MDQISDTGTKSFLAGVVRLSPHAVKAISKATNIDYKNFYKLENKKKSFDFHYSDKEVAHYYLWLRLEGLKRGLRFNTCYIGQGIRDFYSYQSLWTNKADCCDARGNVSSFKTSSQDVNWDLRESFIPPKVSNGNARQVDEAYTREFEANKLQVNEKPYQNAEVTQ